MLFTDVKSGARYHLATIHENESPLFNHVEIGVPFLATLCTIGLPAALVDRRIRSVLCRDRQRRAKACLCLFRGRARSAIGGQAAHEGRGEADCIVTKRKPQAPLTLGLLSCCPQVRLLGWRQGRSGDGVPLS